MKWERVRFTVRCMFGHDIPHPAWALLMNSGKSAVCEQHAVEIYHFDPPTTDERRHLSEVNE